MDRRILGEERSDTAESMNNLGHLDAHTTSDLLEEAAAICFDDALDDPDARRNLATRSIRTR